MKTKTIIIWVLSTFSLLILLMYWGSKNILPSALSNNSSETSKTSEIKNQLIASETFYDFGKISMANGDVSKIFKVTNSSSEDIKVPSLTTSCMCTNAFVIESDGSKKGPFGMPGHGGAVPRVNEIIKAGESRDIEVVYNPNAHGPAGVGLIERSVFLEDENGKIIEFKFKVNVTP